LAWKGQRLAPNICYEDLFGEELGARFLDPAWRPPSLSMSATSAGLATRVAIDQHLQISRVRALEFERPMMRATNTGATVIIDHTGPCAPFTAPPHPGRWSATVEGRTGTTPFAWWVARFGLWPLWIVAIAIVFVAVNARRYMGARNGFAPVKSGHAHISTNHPEVAGLLGRPGLCSAATL
jgi:apolipoprotein N-acyltransferase